MAAPWAAQLVYRWVTIIAGIIVLVAVVNFLYRLSMGEPIIPFVPLIVAAVIWLIGRFCLFLAGR